MWGGCQNDYLPRVRDAQDSDSLMQFLQTIQHKEGVIVMEHWVPIRTCEYHEEQRTPCETCYNAHIDDLTEQESSRER